jgi:hypothetical protein
MLLFLLLIIITLVSRCYLACHLYYEIQVRTSWEWRKAPDMYKLVISPCSSFTVSEASDVNIAENQQASHTLSPWVHGHPLYSEWFVSDGYSCWIDTYFSQNDSDVYVQLLWGNTYDKY